MVHRLIRRSDDDSTAHALARGLGWFSIALGVAELVAPRPLARTVGLEEHARVAQFYGLREIAAGIGILVSKDPAPWIWGRVAGDIVDLASLAPALRSDNPERGHAGMAMAAVAAVTLLDVVCARKLADGRSGEAAHYGYGDRSGYGEGVLRRLRDASPA